MSYDAAYLARSFVQKFHHSVSVHVDNFVNPDHYYLTLRNKNGLVIGYLDTINDVMRHIAAVR